MNVIVAVLCLALAGFGAARAATAEGRSPRTVIALVDVAPDDTLKYSQVHQMATMPLNHLGLIVEPHNYADGLPDLSGRSDVLGILTWFAAPGRPGAYEYLDWAERQIAAGRRFVILGEIGALSDSNRGTVPLTRLNRFLEKLGISFNGGYVPLPVDMAYLREDRDFWGFEDRPPVPPPYGIFRPAHPDASVHVEVGRVDDPGRASAVAVTTPVGGFVAGGYVAEVDFGNTIRRWRVNPFRFFARAFGVEAAPKPDTTTLVGRRIFYSHVDGDGWRSQSEVQLAEKPASAAEVLLDRVVTRYPDLPVTIAPIAAELDPEWVDDPVARRTAAAMFALGHVEAGTHTYSHPFQWSFYRDYDERRERAIIRASGVGSGQPGDEHAVQGAYNVDVQETGSVAGLNENYRIPRAFHAEPFDLAREVTGSVDVIGRFAGGKPVAVLQWSGDTTPFEAAVGAVRQAGIPNINGGDTRFDAEHPSYGFVAPIGIRIGAERQIYASNSNENTYTELWTGRFFGFRHLQETLERTESPIRVKPINIYYHTYSAERIASLNALIDNLEYARRQRIVPVRTSDFARLAEGFFTAGIEPLGDRRWRIVDRGALQTIRFDAATLVTVDFARSTGVLGATALQGSLYVALDPAAPSPVVALRDRTQVGDLAPAERPYLLDSRWPLRDLRFVDGSVKVSAGGFGRGEMTWIVSGAGDWRVSADGPDGRIFDQTISVGNEHVLTFSLPESSDGAVALTMTAIGN